MYMNMILFCTSAVILTILWLSGRKALEPDAGIVLGIRLPREQLEEPWVKALLCRWRRTLRLFFLSGWCSLAPYLFMTGPRQWLELPYLALWIIVLFLSWTLLYRRFVRKMYRLKTENGWFTGRRLQIAGKNGELLLRDEDHYWRKGYYCNPEDPAFLVTKRTGFGWEINLGHRGLAAASGAVILLILFTLLSTAVLPVLRLQIKDFSMELAGDIVEIQSPMYGTEFSLDQVSSISLIAGTPSGAVRTNGFSGSGYKMGHFSCSQYGKGLWYIHDHVPLMLLIRLSDGSHILINQNDPEDTRAMAGRLAQWTGIPAAKARPMKGFIF